MAIQTKTIMGKTYYEADGNLYSTLAAAQAAVGIADEAAERAATRYNRPGTFGAMGPIRGKRGDRALNLRGTVGRKALGELRSVVSPIKTSIGVGTITAAAAGTFQVTTQVDQLIPAGCILYLSGSVAGLAACDGVTSVLIDGQNIFLNSQTVPTDAVNPNTHNAVGILIPKPITKSVTVAAAFNAAGTVRAWFASPSLEIEQALDSCECDD
jgi:hypothetical protein